MINVGSIQYLNLTYHVTTYTKLDFTRKNKLTQWNDLELNLETQKTCSKLKTRKFDKRMGGEVGERLE